MRLNDESPNGRPRKLKGHKAGPDSASKCGSLEAKGVKATDAARRTLKDDGEEDGWPSTRTASIRKRPLSKLLGRVGVLETERDEKLREEEDEREVGAKRGRVEERGPVKGGREQVREGEQEEGEAASGERDSDDHDDEGGGKGKEEGSEGGEAERDKSKQSTAEAEEEQEKEENEEEERKGVREQGGNAGGEEQGGGGRQGKEEEDEERAEEEKGEDKGNEEPGGGEEGEKEMRGEDRREEEKGGEVEREEVKGGEEGGGDKMEGGKEKEDTLEGEEDMEPGETSSPRKRKEEKEEEEKDAKELKLAEGDKEEKEKEGETREEERDEGTAEAGEAGETKEGKMAEEDEVEEAKEEKSAKGGNAEEEKESIEAEGDKGEEAAEKKGGEGGQGIVEEKVGERMTDVHYADVPGDQMTAEEKAKADVPQGAEAIPESELNPTGDASADSEPNAVPGRTQGGEKEMRGEEGREEEKELHTAKGNWGGIGVEETVGSVADSRLITDPHYKPKGLRSLNPQAESLGLPFPNVTVHSALETAVRLGMLTVHLKWHAQRCRYPVCPAFGTCSTRLYTLTACSAAPRFISQPRTPSKLPSRPDHCSVLATPTNTAEDSPACWPNRTSLAHLFTVYKLSNVYVNSVGAAFNHSNLFIRNSCWDTAIFNLDKQARVIHLPRVMGLFYSLSRNFFHMLTEFLPVFLSLAPLLRADPTIPIVMTTDQYLFLLKIGTPLVGSDVKRLNVLCPDMSGVLHTDELIQPLFHGCGCPKGDLNPDVLLELRSRFYLPKGGVPMFDHGWRLRGRVPLTPTEMEVIPKDWVVVFGRRKGSRALVGAKEIADELALLFGANKVVEFDGNLPIMEAKKLFNRAALFVAAHGAALTNIVFMPSKSSVLEIRPTNYTAHCYKGLAHASNVNFYLTYAEGSKGSMLHANLSTVLPKLREVANKIRLPTRL